MYREYNTPVTGRVPAFVNQAYTIHETSSSVPNKTVANSTSQIGKTLSVFTRTDPTVDIDGDGDSSKTSDDTTYQWQRYDGTSSWNNITDATAKTYTVMGPDENKKLRALVSFEYSGKRVNNISTTNEVTIEAFDMGDLAYGISGTVKVGEELTVTESGSLPDGIPHITNNQ